MLKKVDFSQSYGSFNNFVLTDQFFQKIAKMTIFQNLQCGPVP